VTLHTAGSWDAQATHSEYMRRKFDTVIKTDVLFCDDPARVERARSEMRREEMWRGAKIDYQPPPVPPLPPGVVRSAGASPCTTAALLASTRMMGPSLVWAVLGGLRSHPCMPSPLIGRALGADHRARPGADHRHAALRPPHGGARPQLGTAAGAWEGGREGAATVRCLPCQRCQPVACDPHRCQQPAPVPTVPVQDDAEVAVGLSTKALKKFRRSTRRLINVGRMRSLVLGKPDAAAAEGSAAATGGDAMEELAEEEEEEEGEEEEEVEEEGERDEQGRGGSAVKRRGGGEAAAGSREASSAVSRRQPCAVLLGACGCSGP
jgi:hypothetical protein